MRTYRIQLASTAVTLPVDLFETVPTTTQMVKLLGIRLGQSSEITDAQDEELPVSLVTGFTTSGTGGSVPVALPDDVGDSAYGGTLEAFNTTQAVTGTVLTRLLGTWKITAGEFLWLPIPLTESPGGIWLPINTRAVIRIPAPADSITMYGEIQIGVIGTA